jgi:ABC transport system ATP-binding/permease protein
VLVSRSSEPPPQKKKLSYLEAREYAGIEQRIAEAEQVLQSKRTELEDPAIASDAPRLVVAHAEMETAQKNLDALYARWAELEERAGNVPQSRAR